ncbi:MAG: serine/threonine protein kinase [Chloroflexi bacterium]|nr:serine/threonine protein kinase [Chloroflexota bacterium]
MAQRKTGPLPAMIGPYVIQARIGSGGMATVYRAVRGQEGRVVALKVMSLLRTDEEVWRQRFVREAETLLHLHHPNILPVYDFGDDGDVLYLAMKLLAGHSLKEMLGKDRALPIEQVCHIARQIASALDYAHNRGIIHRDIKPSNILFDTEHRPYLADFGVAFVVDSSVRLTTSGGFVGTAAFASPEQCKGEPLHRASDVYSLAAMVYRMITGQPLFDARSPLGLIKKHISEPPPNPLSVNPGLPIALYEVFTKALAKLPQHRFRSAMAFSDALDRALHVQSIQFEVEDDAWLYDGAPPPKPVPPFESDMPFDDEAAAAPRVAAIPLFGPDYVPGDHYDSDDQPEVSPPGVDEVPDTELDDIEQLMAFFPDEDLPPLPPAPAPAPSSASPATSSVIRPLDAAPSNVGSLSSAVRPLSSARSPVVPPSSTQRRSVWLYGVIALSAAIILVGGVLVAVLALRERGVELDGTAAHIALGVEVDYPDGWMVAYGPLTDQDSSTAHVLVLSSYLVPLEGPYTAAAMTITVREVPAAGWAVPELCQGQVASGPAQTFGCMERNNLDTPRFDSFETAHYTGVKLSPDDPAESRVLFPGTGEMWISVAVVQLDGYGRAEKTLDAMAESLRPIQ